MWQQVSTVEKSSVLDVTIQCQFNVAPKNAREIYTTYSPQYQQTTRDAFPVTDLPQCRMNINTPTKPRYQCGYATQQHYHRDSMFVGNYNGLSGDDCAASKTVNINSCALSDGYNNLNSGCYFSCMNDSGYGSPVVQMGQENKTLFSPCAELARQSESGSPVLENNKQIRDYSQFENEKETRGYSDIFNQCKGLNAVNSGNQLQSPVKFENPGSESNEMTVAMRERSVMQRLFSLRSVNNKAASDIEQYYQTQTTDIDLERHNVLCQMAFNKESADSVNKYYNCKLLSLLESVERKLSALEGKKCKITKSKINTDKKSRLLPKHAVKLMQTWYDENLENPYPSREVTLSMASEGEVTVEQIRKWFANKRNRSRNSKLKACDIE